MQCRKKQTSSSFAVHGSYKTFFGGANVPGANRENIQRALPILHARLHALLAGGRHTLHGELPQTASHHGHGSELAAGACVGAVGILSVQPVLGVATHPPAVVRAHQRHLHPGFSASCPDGGSSRLKKDE